MSETLDEIERLELQLIDMTKLFNYWKDKHATELKAMTEGLDGAMTMYLEESKQLIAMTAERDEWKAKHDKLHAFLETSTMIYGKP